MKKNPRIQFSSLKQNRFSNIQLIAFALIFAGIGAYLLLASRAAPPSNGNPRTAQNDIGALIFEKQQLHIASDDVEKNVGRRPLLLPKVKAVASQRKSQLLELFKKDPHSARSVTLESADTSTLKGLGVDVERPVTLSGQMGMLQIDEQTGDHIYYQIITPDQKKYFLDTEQTIPRVKPGSTIQVSGLVLDDQLLVNLSNDADPNYTPTVTANAPLASFAYNGTAPIVTTSVSTTGSTFTTTGNITDAIIMGNFAGATAPAVTASQTQSVYSNNPGNDVASFLHENSGGKATLAPAYFGPYSLPSVSCSSSFADQEIALEAAATAAGANLNNYEVYTYIANCNSFSWASASSGSGIRHNYITSLALNSFHVGAHELSHVMASPDIMLGHGGYVDCAPQVFASPVSSQFDTGDCQVGEYQDPYDVLGGYNQSSGQFGAPHKLDSGWLDSTQYATDNTPGTSSYTLKPIESNSGLILLKIPRGSSGTYFTVEFRQPTGFDSYITTGSCPFCNASQGALIRFGGYTYRSSGGGVDSTIVDMTPNSHPDPSSYFPTQDGNDGTLLPGQSWTDPEYNITIKTVSAGSTGLVVQVTLGSTNCNFAQPTVSSPNPSTLTASPGQTVSYSFTVTNNDSAGCQPDVFKYSYDADIYNANPGYSFRASPDYFTLAPGASTTVKTTITIDPSTTDQTLSGSSRIISRPFNISPVLIPWTVNISSAADTTPPAAPANPQITVLGAAAVKLAWSASKDNVGVAGYKITINGGRSYTATTTAYTIMGLLPSTSYSFTVQAYDSHNNLSAPLTLSATTAAKSYPAPSAPGVPTFTVSDHGYSASWSSAYSPSGIACYVLSYNHGYYSLCQDTGNSLTRGNSPSRTYYSSIGILAFDGDGNVSSSDTRNFTTNIDGDAAGPSTPQQVYVSTHTATGNTVNWQPSTGPRTITGYYIYRGCCKIALTTNTSNYFDSKGDRAPYSVQAVDSDGNVSPISNLTTLGSFGGSTTSDVAPPTASLTAPVANSVVSGTLTLNASASDNVAIKSITYLLDGQHDLGDVYGASPPYSLNIDTTKYADGPHWISVMAHDGSLNAGSSTPVNVTFNNYGNTTPADTTPPTVSITSPPANSTVSGTAGVAATASDNVAVAHVDFLVDGVLKVSDTASPYNYSLNTASLSNGSHTITANAYDTSNNLGSASETVNVSNGDTTAPSTPTNLTATAPAYNQINLSWTASTDNVGVAGYYIVRDGTTIAQSTGTATTYTDNSVNASTAYNYQVMAYDAAGNSSALSNSASVTTPSAPDTTPPTVPSNLAATAVSSSQINLAWAASTDNIGVTAYDIYRNSAKIASVSGLVTSFGDTGLSANTSYSYFVKARDAAGNTSTASTTATATTPPAVQPATGSISGIVTNSSGSSLTSALVSARSGGRQATVYSSSTSSTGSYLLSGLPPATYSTKYTASGYYSQKYSLSVTAGTTTARNVSLNLCTSTKNCK